jgi:5-methyltetrahydrofolate--homocysteine methyltransferase
MVTVAEEMQRAGMTIPLLIGGATTSKVHTALRIDPAYDGPVVHVLDASRAVGVASQLLSDTQAEGFIAATPPNTSTCAKPARARAGQAAEPGRRARQCLRAEMAHKPAPPEQPGCMSSKTGPGRSGECFDWTPFFRAWELAGTYPAILDDAVVGKRRAASMPMRGHARQDHRGKVADGQGRLRLLARRPPWRRRGAAPDDDEQMVPCPSCASSSPRAGAAPISAWPTSSTRRATGWAALPWASTASNRTWPASRPRTTTIRHPAQGAGRPFAEAFAERLHQHVRTTLWGYAPGEQLTNEALIREEYRGIRPAPGYPACPDHSLKPILFDLLDAPGNAGIGSDRKPGHAAHGGGFGLLLRPPGSQYFGVATIGRDQLADYAERRGVDLATAERWLRPNLD